MGMTTLPQTLFKSYAEKLQVIRSQFWPSHATDPLLIYDFRVKMYY